MQETQETQVWSLGWENPLEEEMATSEYSCREKSHGQSSLIGHNSKGHKALDMNELLNTSTYMK